MAVQKFRGLRFEPLEERRLLSVGLAGVHLGIAAQQRTLADPPAAAPQTATVTVLAPKQM